MSGYPRSPRALAQAHPCPVPACRAVVSPGHVGCHEHWMAIPTSKRKVLRQAFRQREALPDQYAAALVLAAELMQEHAA